jgi:response regulator RpfG family c-di-GMP phosphodiesterase
MNTRILCVDDDANILAGYQRTLRKQFALETAHGGADALRLIAERGPYPVVVADMQMPGMNGVQLLGRIRAQWPDTIRVMLTGNADQQTAIDAVNEGHIFRFLTKPCPPERLAATLVAALEQHRLINAERELLEKTLNGAVRLLGDVLSMMDPVAFGRGQSLRDLVRVFATELNTSAWELEMAAMLSQVGWVTLPPTLVLKARSGISLQPSEKALLARVPETGASLLANIPRLEGVARIVRYHAKHFDGGGMPADEVRGEDIPMGSRVLRLLDDLCQLEATGVGRQAALSQMQSREGVYDPQVMQAALKVFDVYLPDTAPAPASAATQESLPDTFEIGRPLARDIITTDGTLVAESGARLTPALRERIRNFAAAGALRTAVQEIVA